MGNVLDCAADKPEDDEGKSTSISFASDEASLLQSGEPVTLQSFTRLCSVENKLWELQKDLKDVGEEAWTQGIVPSFVSSNAFIAKCYAKVIVGSQTEWFSRLLVV